MQHLKVFAPWLWFVWAVSGVPLFLCSNNNNNNSKVHHQTITTTSGKVRGQVVKTSSGKDVVKFLGVPYGDAPVGPLRFTLPKEVQPWANPLSADKLALACYGWKDETFGAFLGSQMWNANTNMTEDCLNMNIWVPRGANLAPVLVWIYGGGFMYGSPSLDLYNGETLATEGNVIVININYRVGPFGFLYLGDDLDLAPGNMGLADQQLALRWIKRNVKSFGGDPNRVTLFGESAGAASVSAHLLSENSWDLFRYAILQSGTVAEPWATKTPRDNRARARKLAEDLNCWRSELSATTACLRNVSAERLQSAADQLSDGFLNFPFVPTSRDDHFFRGDVHDKLKSGRIKKTSVLLGTNTDEGSFWLPYYLSAYFNHTSEGLIDRRQYLDSLEKAFTNLTKLARHSMAYYYEIASPMFKTNQDQNVLLSVDKWKSIFRDLLSKIVGDYYFTCKVLSTADVLTDLQSVVYMYYFTERSTVNPWPKWMGVMHGYEIEYIFGAPLRLQNYTPKEVSFSRRVIRTWVEFAKTGKPPLVQTNDGSVSWPIYGQQKSYVTINSHGETVGHRFNENDCLVWEEINEMCDHDRPKSDPPSSSRANANVNIYYRICFIFVLSLFVVLF